MVRYFKMAYYLKAGVRAMCIEIMEKKRAKRSVLGQKKWGLFRWSCRAIS
jgi:hypothetical protein